jgi:hypothetical protein
MLLDYDTYQAFYDFENINMRELAGMVSLPAEIVNYNQRYVVL